jgi:AcrR family transcriptional regulator
LFDDVIWTVPESRGRMSNRTASPATRDKILEAALKLISKKGYLGATTKEIAHAASIAEVTLFRHFPSKEKLFEAVLNTYSFLPVLKGLMPEIAQLTYEQALTVIAKRFLETLYSRKDIVQIMHSEVQRYPEKIHKIYHSFLDEMIKTLASYFNELAGKGILRQFDTEIGARAFLGMFFAYFTAREFHLFRKFKPADTDEIVEEFVRIFTFGTLT